MNHQRSHLFHQSQVLQGENKNSNQRVLLLGICINPKDTNVEHKEIEKHM